jgi:tagatose 1,6-diphosphate aldolase
VVVRALATKETSMAEAPRFSVGKIRGLQQIANSRGIFTITAMDQRGSLQSMISPSNPKAAGYEVMRRIKLELAEVFSRHSSAVLLDPIYGAAESIASGALDGKCGLLVAVEESGYVPDNVDEAARLTVLLENWGARKVRRMGASAVKLLVYYRPDQPHAAEHQRNVVRRVVADCVREDIPAVVEAVAYARKGQDAAAFAAEKPTLVTQTAVDLTALGFDLFKAEFPADLRYEQDEGKLMEWCRQLNDATRVPWVILSAGVDIDIFLKQVEIACKAGASGFLAGRAIWKDGVGIQDPAERMRWLKSQGVTNLQRCIELAEKYATPWTEWIRQRYGKTVEELAGVSEGWFRTYGE